MVFTWWNVDRNEPIYTAVKGELIAEVGIRFIDEPKLFAMCVNKMFGAADYPFVFMVNNYMQIDHDSLEIAEVARFKIHQLPETISPGRNVDYMNILIMYLQLRNGNMLRISDSSTCLAETV